MTKLHDLIKDNKIYGIAIDDLSYSQGRKIVEFAVKVQPWLEENIGEFDKDWFVVVDREYDSLRLQFKNEELETYFKLAWMQRDHEAVD